MTHVEANVTLNKVPNKEEIITKVRAITAEKFKLLLCHDDEEFAYLTHENCDYDNDIVRVHECKSTIISLRIFKQKNNNEIIVYSLKDFAKYLESLSLEDLVSAISEIRPEGLIFRCKNDNTSFATNTISFSPQGHVPKFGTNDRERIKTAMSNHCNWNGFAAYLQPFDFFPTTTASNGSIQIYNIFCRTCMFLILFYLFEKSTHDGDKYSFQLSGLRTKVLELEWNDSQWSEKYSRHLNDWYSVWQWVYSPAKIDERFSIARNILSINLHDGLTLYPGTLAAIKSNFIILEKEAIKDYLDTRNKISDSLLEFQKQLFDSLDTYTNAIKQGLGAFIAFFLTVIITNCITSQTPFSGFTLPIIIISYVILAVDAIILFFQLSDLQLKIDLTIKQITTIKKMYEPILCKEEIDNIFAGCDMNSDNGHVSIIVRQKRKYTVVWIAGIGLFVVIMILCHIGIL